MNRNEEMVQIRRLFGVWLNEIVLENAESYFDINKVSEHLCRELLNIIFDYNLIDLNTKEQRNFPGLDIGDHKKSKIAFQVTSRTDSQKVLENLQTVVEKTYHKTFTAGIRFLILNATEKIKFGKRAKQPDAILPSFHPSSDILYPDDLIAQIEAIYEKQADLIKFNRVKLLLEKELRPKFPSAVADHQSKEIEALRDLITETLSNAEEKRVKGINIANSFFDDDFDIPVIKNLISRNALATFYTDLLLQNGILWIVGPLSTGKTSIAVAMTANLTEPVLWIECRGIQERQLVEHILNALTIILKVQVPVNARFKGVVSFLVTMLSPGATIILNDLPHLSPSEKTKDHFSYLMGEIISVNSTILITSNFPAPVSLSDIDDLPIRSETIPPFDNDETANLLRAFGATDVVSEALKELVTKSTEGHPLLIRSAAKFLAEKEWIFDEEDLISIFTGKFDLSADQSTYAKLLDATTDTQTRELLYRLKYVIGSFEKSTADLVASIEPAIDHVGERINQLNGIWLQENREGQFRVSPLIKKLDNNIISTKKKAIYEHLAENIIAKKNLSPIDASTAILYFSLAGKNNDAALILIRVLHVFAEKPNMFFDWGFDSYWYRSTLPDDIIPHFKIQIRAAQLNLNSGDQQAISFLKTDMEKIIQTDELGILDKYLANTALFQIDFKDEPLKAMEELKAIEAGGKLLFELEGFSEVFESNSPLVGERLANAIWLIFSRLSKIEDFREWFKKLNPSGYQSQIIDPEDNESYAMAGVSIYRNIVPANRESGSVEEIIKELIGQSINNRMFLLAAYGIKYLIKYLSVHENDLEQAISLPGRYESVLEQSYIYRFLVYTELGRQCQLNNKEKEAFRYLEPFSNIQLPKFYTEQLDYYIAAFQLHFKSDPKLSAAYSTTALALVKDSLYYVIEDKIKMYGEAAIGLAHMNNYKEALLTLAEGYENVLTTFSDTDEYKAIVIRYGHTILYVVQFLSLGVARDFGNGEKFVVPEPGFFYRDNEKLLEGGFYFEERKFIVSTILTDGFENIFDHTNARKWAYTSLELGTAVNETRFLPIIQKFVFFPVEDRQYRQAYNILSTVEQFYKKLAEKVKNETAAEEERSLFTRASMARSFNDDFVVYFFILLPAALDLSLKIVTGELTKDLIQESIDAVFENDRYIPVDKSEFRYAKSIFEKIMIAGISYDEFKKINNEFNGSNKDLIYTIGCFLLSSFTDATQAANLHLVNIISFEKTFQTMVPAFYNFQIIPYFQRFWQQKFKTRRNDFTTPDHLESKGFILIEKTGPEKRIKKIFQILANHLTIEQTKQIEDFINSD